VASPPELTAMRRAITLSAFGLGSTSPNPPVGCVILDQGGRIVGEGYHQRKGEAHAEVNALMGAGEQAAGGTAVVTLEPCNHCGRTPPCHQALIDAGIRRVVVALIDPTSRGEGGIARLRQAGLDVEIDVLADEARLVLGPWLRSLETKHPHVTWAYMAHHSGEIASAASLPDTASLLVGVDAMLHDDGAVTETVPGAHGENVVDFTPIELVEGPAAALSTLYERGVRSVVLDSGQELAEPFIKAGLVDRVVAYVSRRDASTLLSGHEQEHLPEGLRLVEVTRHGTYVRVRAERVY
jgi:diaminohydroxyphosphoribosylaminopyrimidine deaminase / 5-amino-6-(5-phosphoribosylamino)uracil reductase